MKYNCEKENRALKRSMKRIVNIRIGRKFCEKKVRLRQSGISSSSFNDHVSISLSFYIHRVHYYKMELHSC